MERECFSEESCKILQERHHSKIFIGKVFGYAVGKYQRGNLVELYFILPFNFFPVRGFFIKSELNKWILFKPSF